MKAKLINELSVYWDNYIAAQSKMTAFKITAEVDGGLLGYNNLTLDGLLARLVVDEAMQGETLNNSSEPYLLPVPLKLAWLDKSTNIPLWSCNHFKPVGTYCNSVHKIAKRIIKPEMVKNTKRRPKITNVSGRHKEQFISIPCITAESFEADCVGDVDEIARLLKKCNTLGKLNNCLVIQWHFCRIPEFKFNRAIPIEYSKKPPTQFASWSPPYWQGIPEIRGACSV